MNRGKIIVIEGPSNSGKTTTCQKMRKYCNCFVIDECMEYEKNVPKPSQNYQQEIENQLFFFEIEKRRMNKATMLAMEGKNVILDRCALSTVSIAYAFEKIGKYHAFNHALR
jgi:thymidylate kinase